MVAGMLKRPSRFTGARGVAIMTLLVAVGVIGTIILARGGNPEGSRLTGLQPTQVRESPPNAKVSKDFPIKHIVLIIKENRTFDNYFANYPGADGATHGMTSTGERVPLTPATDILEVGLGHHFTDGVKAINGGKMDGFDLVRQGKRLDAYTSFDRAGIPGYWRYADNFVLGDRMFSSMYGPTFPEHLYTVGAQSGRVVSNKLGLVPHEGGYCDDRTERVDRFKRLTDQERAHIMTLEENVRLDEIMAYWEQVWPCFDFEVLPDQLNTEGISWRYYDYNGSWFNAMLAIKHIRFSKYWGPNVVPPNNFLTDIKNGDLQEVTWVVPPPGYNEHPSGPSVCMGENWTVRHMNALMRSKYWKNTAVFIIWDDFGGFYDHVPPPHVDEMGLGPRCPTARYFAMGEGRFRRQHNLRILVFLELRRKGARPRLHDGQRLLGSLEKKAILDPSRATSHSWTRGRSMVRVVLSCSPVAVRLPLFHPAT